MTEHETYTMRLECRNCLRSMVAEVAVGHTAGQWIEANPECPTCKIGGTRQVGGGVHTPLWIVGAA